MKRSSMAVGLAVSGLLAACGGAPDSPSEPSELAAQSGGEPAAPRPAEDGTAPLPAEASPDGGKPSPPDDPRDSLVVEIVPTFAGADGKAYLFNVLKDARNVGSQVVELAAWIDPPDGTTSKTALCSHIQAGEGLRPCSPSPAKQDIYVKPGDVITTVFTAFAFDGNRCSMSQRFVYEGKGVFAPEGVKPEQLSCTKRAALAENLEVAVRFDLVVRGKVTP